jgi:hypothetical protein
MTTLNTVYIDGNDYQPVALRDVKRGEFIIRKPAAKTIYTRGDYDKSTKTYALDDYSDISRAVYLKGSTIVYIGFTY